MCARVSLLALLLACKHAPPVPTTGESTPPVTAVPEIAEVVVDLQAEPASGVVPVILFEAVTNGESAPVTPLACLDDQGTLATGQPCFSLMSEQRELTTSYGHSMVLGEPTEMRCVVDGRTAPALGTDTPTYSGLVFWPAEALQHWIFAGERVAGPELREQVLSLSSTGAWGRDLAPEELEAMTMTEVMRADLDGLEGEEVLVEAWIPSLADIDKPGTGMVFWGSDELEPLPTAELEIIGVGFVQGFLRTPGGGLLVLGSRWMGGSGTHVLWVGTEQIQPVGEWICGS